MAGTPVSVEIPGAAELAGARVAVVGLGKSGTACVQALADATEAVVSAWDADERALEGVGDLDERGAAADPAALAEKALAWKPDVVIPAPAVPEVGPLFERAARAGVPVWSEIELAWRLRAFDDGRAAPWLCVTGTNGKTTAVSMTEAILDAGGLKGKAVGNVGNPAVAEVSRTDGGAAGAFAVELSSFQLRTTRTMSPLASICLNIADDHLEWHGSREAYWRAKARVYERVQAACIYPVGDPSVQRMVDEADVVEGARAIGLTLGVPSAGQVGLVEDAVVDRAFGPDRFREAIELFSLGDLAQLAPAGADLPVHIVCDAMAAAALGRAAGVAPEDVRAALRAFRPGAHRIELAATVDGVRYVDDSKATNAHAARASLGAQADGTTVWIVGGLAKGGRFEDLVADVSGKLRAVVVIGVDQEPWESALASIDVPVTYIDPASPAPMDDAVAAARSHARRGDVVLLAPACASMDQFASYAERGERFAEAARRNDGPY